MSFITSGFLIALVAAAGPTVIHLLNRRRFRTVDWAAMEFHSSAIRRSKRICELRDILLLLLRTLAVLLFVLAMAQPFWSSNKENAYSGEPVHAVMVIDNSLSMAYKPLDKSLLDLAKERAGEFIKTLPDGSRISIIPLCGQDAAHGRTAFASTEDALESLSQLDIVDGSGLASDAAEKAKKACREVQDVITKRVVLISDMQKVSWGSTDLQKYFEGLDNVQVVPVGPEKRGNTWVSEFELLDGVADIETPAVFTATIRYEGEAPRNGVRVNMDVDGIVAEDRTVDLFPGQHLKLVFQHRFDASGTSTEPLFVPVRLSIAGDELTEDNSRTMIVPVVAKMPVVFIDQHGSRERVSINRYGETHTVRKMFASTRASDISGRKLIDVRHMTVGELSVEALKDARLAVIAGVRSPTPEAVKLLRQYVEQGGQLFVAAGAEFEPFAWADTAWLDGSGILPAPLSDMAIGNLPPPGVVKWPVFHLDVGSLSDEVFDLELSEAEKKDIMSAPFFYKAVGVSMESMEEFESIQREKLEEYHKLLAGYLADEKKWTKLAKRGALPEDEARRRDEARSRFKEMNRKLLGGTRAQTTALADMNVDQLVAHTRPVVMGRYDNGEVFAVRRNIGAGTVIMMTSGCFPEWNNISTGPSILILDSMLRNLLARSLPDRSPEHAREVVVPVPPLDQEADFHVFGPGDEEPVAMRADATGEMSFGVRLADVGRRGIYRIHRLPDEGGQGEWTMQLAFNGPAYESELGGVDREGFVERLKDMDMRLVAKGQSISLEGTTSRGRNFWKILMALAMGSLLLEMAILKEAKTKETTP